MAKAVSSRDLSYYAWSGLRNFQNVSYVEKIITDLHNVAPKHKSNVNKQARQIRYCLIQAFEYYRAAQAVMLSTKPTLLYYSIMHLALAEILLKQTGNASLDRIRENYHHHGLTLSVRDIKSDHLTDQAAALAAKPVVNKDERIGTFDLWHRSAREMPLAGEIVDNNTAKFGCIYIPEDEPLEPVPETGITLLNCLRALPDMCDFMSENNISPQIVKGKLVFDINQNYKLLDCILYSGQKELTDAFLRDLLSKPPEADSVTHKEYKWGHVVHASSSTPEKGIKVVVPNGSMFNTTEIRFWPRQMELNEFGLIYVALYIAGNYARYYPDKWMRDVEESKPLALATEQLIHQVEIRMPLLALSELTRTYQVPAA